MSYYPYVSPFVCMEQRDSNQTVFRETPYIIIIIIIIIIINCTWVVTRWQWLFSLYTNMKKM